MAITTEMTGKERLTAAIRGEAVDRAPIWIHGFPIGEPFPSSDHYTKGWQTLPEYRELFEQYQQHIDVIKAWVLGGDAFRRYGELNLTNRFMMTPPELIRFREKQETPNLRVYEGEIRTPRKTLTFRNEVVRGEAQLWRVEHAAKTLDDLVALAEVPFDYQPQEDDIHLYAQVCDTLGERGLVMWFLSEPISTIACAISFEEFLLLAGSEQKVLHELMEEMTRRILLIIDKVFARWPHLGRMVMLGGCEEATPPMMGPGGFEEFVVPYSGRIIERLKQKHGCRVHVHCHGRVNGALRSMIQMGVDSTDPVEPPPQGDVTFAEARAIAGDKLTLVGNIECSELVNEEPAYIRRRVKEVLAHGNRRVIITDSAPQFAAFTRKQADNYRAMIETALECG